MVNEHQYPRDKEKESIKKIYVHIPVDIHIPVISLPW